MKLTKKIVVVFFILLVQMPFFSKAQFDTAHLSNDYINQYIYPQIINPVGYPSRELDFYSPTGPSFATMSDVNYNIVNAIAQRFEVEESDSVTIMGTAFPIFFWLPYDTIKVSIWDTTLTSELFTQYFIIEAENLSTMNGELQPYIECIFNDTITLHEDYFVSLALNVENKPVYTQIPFLRFSEYNVTIQRQQEGYYAPYGVSTKYRPYVQFTNAPNVRAWVYVDDVEWDGFLNYEYVANYCTFGAQCHGDTLVCAPCGICPIQYVYNSEDNSLTSAKLTEENIELYPTPASDELNISSDYNILEIEVFDALNRLIERKNTNSKTMQIDVSQYKSGTYILRIKTEKGKIDKKFIVN